MFSRILVVLDGSEGARAALQRGVSLAKALGAELHAIVIKGRLPSHSMVLSEVKDEQERIEARAGRVQEQARVLAELNGLTLHVEAEYGEAFDTIMRAVDEGRFDLLIVGQQGRVLFADWFKGNTTASIVQHAPCSVLIAKW